MPVPSDERFRNLVCLSVNIRKLGSTVAVEVSVLGGTSRPFTPIGCGRAAIYFLALLAIATLTAFCGESTGGIPSTPIVLF